MATIKMGLDRLPVPDKIQFARQIVIDMTGNANFTTPSPALTAIGTAATALETSYNAAQTARQTAKSLTSTQGEKEVALDLLLSQEANYVQSASAGDQAKIESAGFSTKAPPTPIGDLPAPTTLNALPSESAGTADLKWSGVHGAGSYNIQRATDPTLDTSWVQVATATKTKATVNTMVSGTRYWFRVAGVGSAGQGPWSDPTPIIAP